MHNSIFNLLSNIVTRIIELLKVLRQISQRNMCFNKINRNVKMVVECLKLKNNN